MSDKAGTESQYIVSRPEPGSDPPSGSNRESGCDTYISGKYYDQQAYGT